MRKMNGVKAVPPSSAGTAFCDICQTRKGLFVKSANPFYQRMAFIHFFAPSW